MFDGKLEDTKNEIIAHLNKGMPKVVHSLRGRVKEPDHLIEKIVRNINDKPDKYDGINADNYNKLITDLIGIRIIILDKRDWQDVHNYLLDLFNNSPKYYINDEKDYISNYDQYERHANGKRGILACSYHLEKPVVYITTPDDREMYRDDNLKIDESKSHYRSIHYVIRYGNVIFEVQVRTLFEEGWLEFDHRYNYPYDLSNEKKREFVAVLNSLAQASDRLISFYDEKMFASKTKRSRKQNISNKAKSVRQKKGYEGQLISKY